MILTRQLPDMTAHGRGFKEPNFPSRRALLKSLTGAVIQLKDMKLEKETTKDRISARRVTIPAYIAADITQPRLGQTYPKKMSVHTMASK